MAGSDVSSAEALKDKAENDLASVTQDDVTELVSLLNVECQEARTTAAAAFDFLCERPELFEPVVRELVEFSAYYPRSQDGIPSIARIFGDEDLQEAVFVAESLARAARRDPTVLVSATDDLVEIVRSDRNYPRYHLFTLGMVGAVAPESVPMTDVVERLCSLLDTEVRGYAGWAADTLRRIGDPSVLPELRENYPDQADVELINDSTVDTFDEAITELETIQQSTG